MGMILAVFDLQVTPLLPTKFKVNKPFDFREEAKNSHGRHLGFPFRKILAIFDL